MNAAFWEFIEQHKLTKPSIVGLRLKATTWVRPGLQARVRHLRGEESVIGL
jgi:hypothetical protein